MLTFSRVALFVVVLASSSCKPPSGDTWVVLSRRSKSAEATWIPTATQVVAAREAAKRYLVGRSSHSPTNSQEEYAVREIRDILSRFDTYRLQACGRTQNGRRIIHLNFLIPRGSDDLSWRNNELVLAFDGYSAYWRSDYDPEKDSVISWDANGDA